jgi:hypothetical protein
MPKASSALHSISKYPTFPVRFHAQYSSSRAVLSAVTYDSGQVKLWTRFLLQTGRGSLSSAAPTQEQRRLISRPAFLQLSQFHPAWLENSK